MSFNVIAQEVKEMTVLGAGQAGMVFPDLKAPPGNQEYRVYLELEACPVLKVEKESVEIPGLEVVMNL
jgi:hypothetical protein